MALIKLEKMEDIENKPKWGYLWRDLSNPTHLLDDGSAYWEYAKVPENLRNVYTTVNSFIVAHNKSAEDVGLQYAATRCQKCDNYHNQQKWTGLLCYDCNPYSFHNLAPEKKVAKQIQQVKLAIVRKEGDIWELPKSHSPMWTRQWGYQHLSGTKYIVSLKTSNSVPQTKDGWACSCPNFTKHVPRTPCNHILNVMLKVGIKPTAGDKLANVDEKQLAEFEKWQREKAAAKKGSEPTAGAKLNLFGVRARKFR